MQMRELPENRLTTRGDPDEHPAAVASVTLAHDQPFLVEPVDQPDGTVMSDVKARGQRPDGRRDLRWQSLQGQQQLVLLSVQSMGARGALAEGEEAADPVPELGQRSVVRARRATHVSKYRNTI